MQDTAASFPLTRFDAGMSYRLTQVIVTSADGSRLLRRWMDHMRWPVAPMVLADHHNEPGIFLQGLVRSMAPIVDLSLQGTEPMDDAISELLNAAARTTTHSALVLQGYDVIHASVIHNALARMLDYLPPSLHMFIASAAEVPLPNIARLRVRRQLLVLTV
jgi:LuxR family maltose regulon positive regulatory protein